MQPPPQGSNNAMQPPPQGSNNAMQPQPLQQNGNNNMQPPASAPQNVSNNMPNDAHMQPMPGPVSPPAQHQNAPGSSDNTSN
jgi:hypothetical protein